MSASPFHVCNYWVCVHAHDWAFLANESSTPRGGGGGGDGDVHLCRWRLPAVARSINSDIRFSDSTTKGMSTMHCGTGTFPTTTNEQNEALRTFGLVFTAIGKHKYSYPIPIFPITLRLLFISIRIGFVWNFLVAVPLAN